ncbi:MAG: hypothetical protein IPJ71_04290 [Bdellovibrionales bacterium]|nr:hypothetical protein [Bdellovibrionales bacterium]
MLAALKELILLIASIVVIAHATSQREWLWRQIATVRHVALTETKKDWGCPSIFNKSACKKLAMVK